MPQPPTTDAPEKEHYVRLDQPLGGNTEVIDSQLNVLRLRWGNSIVYNADGEEVCRVGPGRYDELNKQIFPKGNGTVTGLDLDAGLIPALCPNAKPKAAKSP